MTQDYQKYTDDIIALVVVAGSTAGYFTGIEVPTEPLMLVLGYFFGKKVAAAGGR